MAATGVPRPAMHEQPQPPPRQTLLLLVVFATVTAALPQQQPPHPAAAGGLSATVTYQPTWESLDTRPTPGWWVEQKFSLVSCFIIHCLLLCWPPSLLVCALDDLRFRACF